MQGTFVKTEIIFIIRKDAATIEIPIIPNLKLSSAAESFLGSPSAFINLKPPKINIIRAVTPANARRALRRFKKIVGMQERVATPVLVTQSSQALNIIKE